MRSSQEPKNSQLPTARTDKSLDQYSDKNLFPEKVKKAREAIEKHGLPGQPKKGNP